MFYKNLFYFGSLFCSLNSVGINVDFRKYIVCTSSNCLNLKINKVKAVFFSELVNLCRQLLTFSCLSVNPYFIIDVFGTEKRGQSFFGQYLEM